MFLRISFAALLALGTLPATAETASVNGVDYHYEIEGEGPPLLMLHGGLGSHDMFDPILPGITGSREVILVDLYGHGRTALTDRPVSLHDMGDDMAALVEQLGYDSVDVLGYSMGGGVALRMAIQHPESVGRMAVVSAGFARAGTYPEILAMQEQLNAAMAPAMEGTPMRATYDALAPRPEDFPRLLDEMGALMADIGDWSDEVADLTMPVMLVYGDADMVMPQHAVEFFNLLGGGLRDGGWMREGVSQNRLAIIPGRTHYEMFMAPELVPTVMPFLNDAEPAAVWTGEAGQ